jgi:hypothetical protein
VAFVDFADNGSTFNSGTITVAYNVPVGVGVNVAIEALTGSSCKLTSNAQGASTHSLKITSTGNTGWMIAINWGISGNSSYPAWPVGNYTITATCSLAGFPDVSATQAVTITPLASPPAS